MRLELKRYVSKSGIFTLLIAKSHYANRGDVGGSKHNADVTGVLYHRQGKDTCKTRIVLPALGIGRENGMNVYLSDILSGML